MNTYIYISITHFELSMDARKSRNASILTPCATWATIIRSAPTPVSTRLSRSPPPGIEALSALPPGISAPPFGIEALRSPPPGIEALPPGIERGSLPPAGIERLPDDIERPPPGIEPSPAGIGRALVRGGRRKGSARIDD